VSDRIPGRPAVPAAEPDAYEVLGVSPRAEDVVVRAAYRALLNKYTTAGRLPDDPAGDDRRIREVQAAYDLVGDAALRRAYDRRRAAAPVVPAPPPATDRRPAQAPARRNRPALWAGLALIALALAGLAVAMIVISRSSAAVVLGPQRVGALAAASGRTDAKREEIA